MQRIWDAEIKRVLTPANRLDALKEIYLDLRSSLGQSASIMDFFATPSELDPYLFIKEKALGGNWLRVKSWMEDLTEYEAGLLDTPGERLLQHLEKELSPVKSYKMVVLRSLLTLGGVEWRVEEIAKLFLQYYLENRDRLLDYDELARDVDPIRFPISKVAAHLAKMPLEKLENTGGEFFELDKNNRIFRIRKDYQDFWLSPEFQCLIQDRIEFALARYFYRKERGSSVSSNMRGFAVEVAYASRRDKGFTEKVRNVIADNPEGIEWECTLGGKGYCGKMDVEVHKDEHFVAWTSVRYDDPSRFPARIKAAATALFEEGLQGEFHVVAESDRLKIVRK